MERGAAALAVFVCSLAFAQAPAEFKDPPQQFRPIVAWECERTAELPSLKASGFGGIVIPPAASNACVGAARAAQLDVWLDATPPPPDTILLWRELTAAELQKAIVDPATIAIYDVAGRTYRRVSSSSEQAKGALIQFFTRRAPRRGAATAGFPWSREFPAQFQEINGYDLLAKLPLLAVPAEGFDAVRHDLWRTAAQLAARELEETAARLGIKLLPAEVTPADLGPRERNDRLARAAWFAAQGTPVDRVLLLDPAGSLWAHWTPAPRKPESVEILEQRFNETRELLRGSSREFNVVDEQHIAERVPGHTVLVVPPAYRWEEDTFRIVDQFLAGGGRVIFRGSQPALMQQLLARRNAFETGNDPEAFIEALEKAAPRGIVFAAEGVVSRHNQDARRHYFLLTNTGSKPQRGRVTVQIAGAVDEWDLSAGAVRRVRQIEADLPPGGMYAFTVESPAKREAGAVPQPKPR